MINCLSPIQKFFALLWAATGIALTLAIVAMEKIILEIMAPEAFANGLGATGGITMLVVAIGYVGLSMTQRENLEFLDKIYHAGAAAFLNNRRSEGRVNRWRAERQLIEGWEEHVGHTGCKVNFENICAYLDNEYDIEIDELEEWQRNGSARKALTDAQARQIIKTVAETVEIA